MDVRKYASRKNYLPRGFHRFHVRGSITVTSRNAKFLLVNFFPLWVYKEEMQERSEFQGISKRPLQERNFGCRLRRQAIIRLLLFYGTRATTWNFEFASQNLFLKSFPEDGGRMFLKNRRYLPISSNGVVPMRLSSANIQVYQHFLPPFLFKLQMRLHVIGSAFAVGRRMQKR